MEEEPKVIPEVQEKKIPKMLLPLVSVVVIILLGVVTGYVLVSKTQQDGSISGGISKGKEIGSSNEKVFKDDATGVIEKGGIDGEGTHKLIREGGPSQTAYLNSSVIDLDQFVGKKVQVWGETNKGQKASWLMDVGKVKILE